MNTPQLPQYLPKPPKTRTLSPKQIAVLAALTSGATNEQAAQLVGCSLATIERYKANPTFRESMAKLASETLLLVSEKLIALSLRSVEVLEEIISSDETRTIDRLRAIELVFNNLEKAKALSFSVGDRVGGHLEEVKPKPETTVLCEEKILYNGQTLEETEKFFNSLLQPPNE